MTLRPTAKQHVQFNTICRQTHHIMCTQLQNNMHICHKITAVQLRYLRKSTTVKARHVVGSKTDLMFDMMMSHSCSENTFRYF